MKMLFALLLSFGALSATFAQDSWKLTHNGSVVLQSKEEDPEGNSFAIRIADFNKAGALLVAFKGSGGPEWIRTIMVVDEGDSELATHKGSSFTIPNAQLRSLFKKIFNAESIHHGHPRGSGKSSRCTRTQGAPGHHYNEEVEPPKPLNGPLRTRILRASFPTMSRHLLYLINPISGSRRKGGLRELIGHRTEAAGLRYTIESSVAGADYGHLHNVIRSKGITDIVIAGGDGTVNGALQHFKDFDLSFGIIPCGSGNGLAFGAGIPKAWDAALEVVFRGNAVPTDAFEINGQFACMLCGLGFDAQVAHSFANDPGRGLSTYIKKTFSHFFSAKAYPFTLQAGEELLQTEALFISIANSNQFGNHFTIAPKASLSDGLLDIVIVARQTKLSMVLQTIRQVRGFNRLYTEKIGDAKGAVIYFQTESLHIKNPSAAPLHIDGDPAPTSPAFDIRVLKNCFRLLCP